MLVLFKKVSKKNLLKYSIKNTNLIIRDNDVNFDVKELTFVGRDVKAFKNLFLNSLVKQGKKVRAENWFHLILFKLKMHVQGSISQFDLFFYTFVRLRPLIALRPIKIGRTLYRLPMWLSLKKKNAFAVKTVLKTASIVKGTHRFSFDKFIEVFLLNFLHKDNEAYQAKVVLHKEAWNNVAFIRFLKWL